MLLMITNVTTNNSSTTGSKKLYLKIVMKSCHVKVYAIYHLMTAGDGHEPISCSTSAWQAGLDSYWLGGWYSKKWRLLKQNCKMKICPENATGRCMFFRYLKMMSFHNFTGMFSHSSFWKKEKDCIPHSETLCWTGYKGNTLFHLFA